MIRRLAAAGVRQKDIAEKTGLKEPAISKIVHGNFPKESESTINAIPATAEIESLQRKLEEAEGDCGEGRADATVGITHCQGQYK